MKTTNLDEDISKSIAKSLIMKILADYMEHSTDEQGKYKKILK